MGKVDAGQALTEFEAQCADLQAAGLTIEQSAAILEVGPGSVRQALRMAALKQEPAHAEGATNPWNGARRQQAREFAAVAKNWRTEELTVPEKPEEGKEPLRWAPWPFPDHARQAG